MNFNDFASQMLLKYRVALAIAILKSKPESLLLDQHINKLKAKITETEMDYDSDVTVCSDDFLMDDDVVEVTKINRNVEEANLSVNILEGFDLEEFVEEGKLRDNELDTQILNLFEENPPDEEVNETSKNIPSQSTFCESAQSQNLLNEFELLQSNMTFCETETVKSKRDYTTANIITKKENKLNNSNITINPNGPSQSTHTYDSQKTQLYSLQGFCEDFTHVSESQSDFWKIKNNHLYNNPTNKSTDLGVVKEKEVGEAIIYNNSVHTQGNNKNINVYDDNTELVLSETQKGKDKANIIETNTNKILYEVINRNHSIYTSQNNTVGDVNRTKSNNNIGTMDINVNDVNAKIDSTETLQNFDNTENANNYKQNNTLDKTVNYEKVSDDPKHYQLYIDDDRIIQENSQPELIPFKVIEELNRVKNYLNRKDRALTEGYATDSGYRSDSQSRNSNKSLHSSDAWINQSAHCLLRFLMDSPTVLRTRDISIEISWTLGRLIDKLHDEEKYPSFMEEILDTVGKLLRDIYEGDSYVEVIFQKDIYIHKLFYLNRSHHIIKYTMDKITHLLETLLSLITEDSILEITDTIHMENLCYIFHILEYIIKRHAVTKDILSQNSTQTSQNEDKSLKRSSLTEMWRKKWNPNYKSESQQLNPQTICTQTKCSEILNKIIVRSMNSYSLISFAALQCYNLLQS